MAQTKTKSRSRSGSAKKKPSSASEQPERTPAQQFANWPSKGGGPGTQPWDLRGLGLKAEADDLEPGAPNTVAPVVPDHGKPILTSGAGGDDVRELAERLGVLGYPSSITQGRNPFGIFDDTVQQAVAQFRNEYGVDEDPTPFGGEHEAGRAAAAAHVGPYVWEAVIRASDREREKASA